MDSGKVIFCSEESFGTGSHYICEKVCTSHHIREKDSLWVVLFWLNLFAMIGKIVAIVQYHWRGYGRFYALCYDYGGVLQS
ncbi:phosphoglucomutase [Bartonella japonica]|uniref:Phosphoglucomutase n=1 Tax=Bartonella japonica TaxID=357761 RepID=A0ABV2FQ62_9HYPH